MQLRLATSEQSGTLWMRIRARVVPGEMLETFGGTGTLFQDPRVADFAQPSGGLTIAAATTLYAPVADTRVLGEFLHTFGRSCLPTDEEIVDFYGQYGNLGDALWMERLPDSDREELPAAARLGLREPVWYARELAAEIELCCALYRALREEDTDLIRYELGPVPTRGRLVEIALLAGTLLKRWASPEDLRTKVGSFGEWSPAEEDSGRPMTDDEATHWARSILQGLLNRYEARASRQWVPRAELPISGDSRALPKTAAVNPILSGYRTIVFDSLVTALYSQLSDVVASRGLLRRCRFCDRIYLPPRGNAYYCTPRCANAERQRRFQQQRGATQPEDDDAR